MREVFDVGWWDLDALVKGVVSIVFMRLASAFLMFKLSFESGVNGGLMTADYHWRTVTGGLLLADLFRQGTWTAVLF